MVCIHITVVEKVVWDGIYWAMWCLNAASRQSSQFYWSIIDIVFVFVINRSDSIRFLASRLVANTITVQISLCQHDILWIHIFLSSFQAQNMARQIDFTKVSNSYFLIKGEGKQSNGSLILASSYSEILCSWVLLYKPLNHLIIFIQPMNKRDCLSNSREINPSGQTTNQWIQPQYFWWNIHTDMIQIDFPGVSHEIIPRLTTCVSVYKQTKREVN